MSIHHILSSAAIVACLLCVAFVNEPTTKSVAEGRYAVTQKTTPTSGDPGR